VPCPDSIVPGLLVEVVRLDLRDERGVDGSCRSAWRARRGTCASARPPPRAFSSGCPPSAHARSGPGGGPRSQKSAPARTAAAPAAMRVISFFFVVTRTSAATPGSGRARPRGSRSSPGRRTRGGHEAALVDGTQPARSAAALGAAARSQWVLRSRRAARLDAGENLSQAVRGRASSGPATSVCSTHRSSATKAAQAAHSRR